nr:uncharacterized protein LOC111420328 [Onthophagus taurus]
MKKMKVAHCAQVLSHTMAATISMMARNNEISSDGTVTMPKEAIATDKILKFFDNLFDSVNGSLRINSEGKPLKMVAKSTSDHRNFWIDSIKHLGNMWFEDHIKKTRSIPPSLKNWVTTLKGMLSILCYVERKKLPFFIPRQINQDPLENMFGQIRQMRGRNINPTCQGFGDAFKSLLVRKMLSPHLAGGNCEEDNSKNLLKPTVFLNKCRGSDVFEEEEFELPPLTTKLNHSYQASIFSYVAGYVARKALRKNQCEFCITHIVNKSPNRNSIENKFLVAKEYGSAKLVFCKPTLLNSLKKCFDIIYSVLEHNFQRNYLLLYIKELIKRNVTFTFLCHKDDIIE